MGNKGTQLANKQNKAKTKSETKRTKQWLPREVRWVNQINQVVWRMETRLHIEHNVGCMYTEFKAVHLKLMYWYKPMVIL